MGCCNSAPAPPVLPHPSSVGLEEALKLYYQTKILPMERRHDFEHFMAPPLDPAEFFAKPSVLLLGQYSVGKTSMIRYLLGNDYPGSKIGPEPTTDQFVVIMHGEDKRILPGPALVLDQSFPFKCLSIFGQSYLQRLSGALFKRYAIIQSELHTKTQGHFCPAPCLNTIFIDTPGILSGDKQRISRGYDFDAVIKFLSDKVDCILLLFDISKLDISDEFKVVLQSVQGNSEKIRILLNKADTTGPMELNKVRGALMWNLGMIIATPEVPKVFVGSFWDQPLKQNDEATKLMFTSDYLSLLDNLRQLPRSTKVRKINDLVKRAKMVKWHALIMEAMIKRGSSLCSCSHNQAMIKAAANRECLTAIYKDITLKFRIRTSDLPPMEHYIAKCLTSDYRRWAPIDVTQLALLDEFIEKDVLLMIKALPSDNDINVPEIAAIGKTVDQLQKQLPDNLKELSKHRPGKDSKPTSSQEPGPVGYIVGCGAPATPPPRTTAPLPSPVEQPYGDHRPVHQHSPSLQPPFMVLQPLNPLPESNSCKQFVRGTQQPYGKSAASQQTSVTDPNPEGFSSARSRPRPKMPCPMQSIKSTTQNPPVDEAESPAPIIPTLPRAPPCIPSEPKLIRKKRKKRKIQKKQSTGQAHDGGTADTRRDVRTDIFEPTEEH